MLCGRGSVTETGKLEAGWVAEEVKHGSHCAGAPTGDHSSVDVCQCVFLQREDGVGCLAYESVVGVKGLRDRNATAEHSGQHTVFGATTNLELVGPFQYLLKVVAAGGCTEIKETGLVWLGIRDHLAAFCKADDDVVDVEALKIVVSTATRVIEVAISCCWSSNIVTEISRASEEVQCGIGRERDGIAEGYLTRGGVDICDGGASGHKSGCLTVDIQRRPHKHAHFEALDGREGDDVLIGNRRGDREDCIRCERVAVSRIHLACGAEVKPQTDVGGPGPLAKVDASLSPCTRRVKKFLRVLV